MTPRDFIPYRITFVSPKLKRLHRLFSYLNECGQEAEVLLRGQTAEDTEGELVLVLEPHSGGKSPLSLRMGGGSEALSQLVNGIPGSSASFLEPDSLFYTCRKPLSSRLPFDYQRVPAVIRIFFRNHLFRRASRGIARFEEYKKWYLATFFDLKALLMLDTETFGAADGVGGLYPEGREFAFLMTHDVDSEYGQKKIQGLLDIEENSGLRSCSFFVPASYQLNHRLLESMISKGHEIGCHDVRHDTKIAFTSESNIRREFEGIRGFVRAFDVKGFRAAGFLRTQSLMTVVSETFKYDSSIPEKRIMPYLNGCFRQHPFNMFNGLLEIPMTLPSDGELLSLGFSVDEIFEIWRSKIQILSLINGCAVFLNHPEIGFSDGKEMTALYEKFLGTVIADFKPWICLPRELSDWRQGRMEKCKVRIS